MLSVGIDPGWKNLGAASVRLHPQQEFDEVKNGLPKIEVIKTLTVDMSDRTEEKVMLLMSNLEISKFPDSILIERYVAYANMKTAETENITMVIGMLKLRTYSLGTALNSNVRAELIRAIDWKTELVKLLNKYYNFENPALDLNKKFSLAAAKFIVTNPERIKTDHEADAICLAALPLLRGAVAQAKQSNRT